MRHESLWIATSDGPGFGPLDAPIDVDVAMLGAGIAGLTTALLLKNAGLRVAVIEAAESVRDHRSHDRKGECPARPCSPFDLGPVCS